MSFSQFDLHPDLLRGVREMGFTRPTPIQADAIPPAMAGRDVLACAMTGSGKTAAFLLPILHHLLPKQRGATRALVLTPDARARGADRRARAGADGAHAALRSAAVFGGVAMGPQEHAFRTGVDVMVATPGRLLDHFRFPYAKLEQPRDSRPRRGRSHARHGIPPGHPPRAEAPAAAPADAVLLAPRCPRRSRSCRARCSRIRSPSTSSASPPPAVGITQAVYPVAQNLKAPLLLELLQRGDIKNVLVFTRTKHRANRLAETLSKRGVAVRAHSRQSQPGPADRGARGLQGGALPGARRDRHRGARHRRRGAVATSSTSTCPTFRTTTSTASAAPRGRR